MKKNRYKTSTKKSFNKKYILPIALITMVIALASYTTLAWVVSNSNAINNKFRLQTLNTNILEKFDGTVKTEVAVHNTGDAKAYIRVALVEQITNADGSIIKANTTGESYFDYVGLDSNSLSDQNWIQIGDYYYFKPAVPSQNATSILLSSAKQKSTVVLAEGEKLSLTVMTEAIQVNGVVEAWGVTLDEKGWITGGNP